MIRMRYAKDMRMIRTCLSNIYCMAKTINFLISCKAYLYECSLLSKKFKEEFSLPLNQTGFALMVKKLCTFFTTFH